MAIQLAGVKATTHELIGASEIEADLDSIAESTMPGEFLDSLIASGQLAEGVRFLSCAMTPAQAIAWAYKCVRSLVREGATEPQKKALAAVEGWLSSPDDGKRRAAKGLADEAPLASPEGCIAMAVFFAEGSISPEPNPAVPPPPHVCQRIAAGAIVYAVVSDKPEKSAERFREAVNMGIALLGGKVSV
jgi:hypothetical protein